MIEGEALSKIGIHQWHELDGAFTGSDIFVGNGFSINICERLNYKRLLEVFSQEASSELMQIFNIFKTSNFEYILEALRTGKVINNFLGIESSKYDELIDSVKAGLIRSIQKTHPTSSETNFPLMESLAQEFLQFKDIYTTNYDIFLYRIVLATKELIESRRIEGIPYHDDFYDEISPTELGYGGSYDDNLRKIYYLHGSLFFYRKHIKTYKLRKIDKIEYITLIGREVANGNLPVFVAEGSSSDKQLAINNNSYLSFCTDVLKRKRSKDNNKLTVYGFSFSRADSHLVDLINKSGVEEMAVSLWPGQSMTELESERFRINGLFNKVDITFYDSRSLFDFKGKYQYFLT